MNTDKAAYWIALGVLALGLNSENQHGHFGALHQAADRAGSVLCRVSARAAETLAFAIGRTDEGAVLPDDAVAAVDRAEMTRDQAETIREQARAQAEMVREQVRNEIVAQRDVLRAQAEMRRAEIEHRWGMRSEFKLARTGDHRVAMICPKTGARVMVSESDIDGSPDVVVSDTF
jgi:hypothetical protein